MIITGVIAASAAGALLGGALFGGNQIRQNRKVMEAVYASMATAREFNKACDKMVDAVVGNDSTQTIEAEVVEESSDSADADDGNCTYSVGDTVFVPDGVISEGGFAIRSGNYRVKKIDGDILVIQKSKKTRTFRVRAEEVEKRG